MPTQSPPSLHGRIMSPAGHRIGSGFLLDSEYLGKRRERSGSPSEVSPVEEYDLMPRPRDHRLSPPSPNTVLPSPSTNSAHSTTLNDASIAIHEAHLGEDNLTLRRREANRLAAQRFRSRKKGYQDSLEEKVRQLEEDKELLMRKMTEAAGPGTRGNYATSVDHEFRPWLGDLERTPEVNRPSYVTSPERREPVDVDIRIASLESANRRSQDELRNVGEENDRLRQELEQWRRWERDQREPRAIAATRHNNHRPTPHRHPSIPSYDRSLTTSIIPISRAPETFSTATYSILPHSPVHNHRPSVSIGDGHGPPPSPGIRLPPIRLAPIHTSTVEPLPSEIRTHYLPRPAELDNVVNMKSPTSSTKMEDRPVAEERRR